MGRRSKPSIMFLNTIKSIASRAAWMTATLGFCLVSGCASGPQTNPTDPLEPFNRKMFDLNEGIDKAVLKPVAQGYQTMMPRPVRLGVSNFFNNLEDLWSSLNGALQLRPKVAADDFMRFSVNTVLGLGGVLDVASELGIERYNEDFGKTLGRWGVRSGPYIVLPLFGPTTLRDSTTILIENRYDPVTHLDPTRLENGVTVLRLVDTRAGLLRLTNMLDDMALDKYSFTRDAYLQKRRAEIFRPGQENDDDAPNTQDKK